MKVAPCQNSIPINWNRQNKLTSRICQGAASPSFGPFGPCNMPGLLRDVNKGACTPLRLYNQKSPPMLGFEGFALD